MELVTGLKELNFQELRLAMRGFHSSRRIGRGAPENVYKVFFNSLGTIDVVKRSKHFYEGKTKFLVELMVIAFLRHRNSIQRLG
jgi:hypothetical protein